MQDRSDRLSQGVQLQKEVRCLPSAAVVKFTLYSLLLLFVLLVLRAVVLFHSSLVADASVSDVNVEFASSALSNFYGHSRTYTYAHLKELSLRQT